MLDALRFGLVPPAAAKELTIGYDAFERWALHQMPDSTGVRYAAVTGPFGSGKSHAMALVRQLARGRGALTAHVEIDGKEVTLADPAGILRALWPTLDGDGLDRAHSLLSLYLRALGANRNPIRGTGSGLSRVQDNLALVRLLVEVNALDHFADDLDAVLASAHTPTASALASKIYAHLYRSRAIEKREVRLRPLIGRQVEDRANDFVTTLVGYSLLAQAGGWSGILITIDEFEIDGKSLQATKERVIATLAALARLRLGNLGVPAAPLSVVFATIEDGGSAVSSKLMELIVGKEADARWKLPLIEASGRRELASRIATYHARAHGGKAALDSGIVDMAEKAVHAADETIRPFVKHIVWGLDCHLARQ